MGGSVFIIPLLPFLTGLEALAALQLSLFLILVISAFNSLSFVLQGLVLWDWFIRGALPALAFSFLSGFFVTYLSSFEIRCLLWLFLGIILSLPWLLKIPKSGLNSQSQKIPITGLKRIPASGVGRTAQSKSIDVSLQGTQTGLSKGLKQWRGLFVFSSLMGICCGTSGLGGGIILSPYLHESAKIPLKNIPAVTSSIMFFVSSFALLGQISQTGFSFWAMPHWRFCFFLILIPSLLGAGAGYLMNVRYQNLLIRRLFLRSMVAIMLCKLTIELFF